MTTQPTTGICPQCHGNGLVDYYGDPSTCDSCGGTGKVSTARPTDPPAGPEMDLAVARACGFDAQISAVSCEVKRGEMDGAWRHFRPSRNIADAFEALDVMIEEGWSPSLEWCGGKWYMQLTHGEIDDALETDADTPELSICRAIVRAGKGGGE